MVMTREQKFHTDRLSVLIGYKVVGTCYGVPDEFHDAYFGLTLKGPRGHEAKLWFLRDDEGNGPGSFQLDMTHKQLWDCGSCGASCQRDEVDVLTDGTCVCKGCQLAGEQAAYEIMYDL